MTRAYYNEHDPFAAEWLRMLIACGHIADGDVDTRSIEDVRPSELRGYCQVHLFAGIGGWSRAFRLAGVPDSYPLWSCSCPCQPFSAAGKGMGFADERHLWPAANHLISQCAPIGVIGEQVAAKSALSWIDLVQTDMEAAGYAFGKVDLCAAGIGAPHIRQRLYWCADSLLPGWSERRAVSRSEQTSGSGGTIECTDSNGRRCEEGWSESSTTYRDRNDENVRSETQKLCFIGVSSDSERNGRDRSNRVAAIADSDQSQERIPYRNNHFGVGSDAKYSERRPELEEYGESHGRDGLGGLRLSEQRDDSIVTRLQGYGGNERTGFLGESEARSVAASGATRGFWSPADWWYGRDQKYRPIEPGLFPLAHGVPKRMGRLRGYGNAIVPQIAAEFVRAFYE